MLPRGLNQYQVESFEEFVECGVPAVARKLEPIEFMGHRLSLGEWSLWPQVDFDGAGREIRGSEMYARHLEDDGELRGVTPLECYQRGLSCHGVLRAELLDTSKGATSSRVVTVGFLPLLVGSKWVPLLDPAGLARLGEPSTELEARGFFLAKGKARAAVAAENQAPNRAIFTKQGDEYSVVCASYNTSSRMTMTLSKGALVLRMEGHMR